MSELEHKVARFHARWRGKKIPNAGDKLYARRLIAECLPAEGFLDRAKDQGYKLRSLEVAREG